MKNMRKWMLGAAVVAGAMGLGATAAHAAEFGIYARGPVAYVPPCPGPGYEWQAGYTADGYWVPGRWAYMGHRDRDDYRVTYDRDRYRTFHDDRGWRDRDNYRDQDGDRDFHRDHDRDRGWDRR